MADEAKTDKATEQEAPAKSGKMKAVIIVAAVMVLEAGAIVGTMALSGGPKPADGASVEVDDQAEQNKLVEVLVVKGKFDNHRTGRTYLYDTEIFVTVRNKHSEQFALDLEEAKTQVSVDVQTIFRRLEPAHFQEPTLATLTRQIKAKLDERFGNDTDDEPIIESVLVAKCLKYRAD